VLWIYYRIYRKLLFINLIFNIFNIFTIKNNWTMIKAFVIIGLPHYLPDVNGMTKISLPYLPKVGDKIYPNEEINQLITKYRESLVYKNSKELNYVISIGYKPECEFPIICLGSDPSLIKCVIWDGKKRHYLLFQKVPDLGDKIVFNSSVFYISSIEHDVSFNRLLLKVSESPKSNDIQNVFVVNDDVPVYVKR